MEISFFTKRGNGLGFCKGYSMRFYRVRKCDDKWLWRCTKKNCGGTAMSTNSEDLVEVNKHHGHMPDTTLVEVRKRLSEAVSAAERNYDTPVRSIVDRSFSGLSGETLLMMPAKTTLRDRLTRHRNNDIGAVNRGEHSENWPENIKQTQDGRNFLHYDSATELYLGPPSLAGLIGPALPPRFLVFTTACLLRLLKVNHHWAMDGTFYAAPKGYKQMYVVGFYALNVDGTSTFYPCIYILLQSKKDDVYRQAFSTVFPQFVAENQPISVMMDFETAAKNAMLSFFPDVAMKHCLFHLFQSFYKRAEKEKIRASWSILDVKIVLRCLPSLAFLPIGETEDGFNEVQAAKEDLVRRGVISGDLIAHIDKLFTYFEKNYVRRPNGNAALYPALLWNMCERAKAGLPRTNNGVENWNGIFNGYFTHDNPPLANVIFKLQVDEEKTRQKILIQNRNPLPRVIGGTRSKTAIYSANQIQQLVINYINGVEQSRLEFLVSIAAHLEKYHGK